MKCPECNTTLSKKYHCERCGDDAKVFIKIVKTSNMYYNDGLKKAKVRDLTGAIRSLRESLNLYKKNTVARNLLGLIYYEMGETVAALREWVISKHFQNDNNDADEYMNAVQSNPTKLDSINQAIKRYNAALTSAKNGNEDLAIIQLKKVTSLNPRFIRAHQLLALLYLKENELDKANKCLLKIKKIDVTNTITLRYLQETNSVVQTRKENFTPQKSGSQGNYSNKSTIIPVSTYKEDKPNYMAFINLILGVLLGIAVVYILIVPTMKKSIKEDLNSSAIDYIEQLNTQVVTIDSLEKANENLQGTIDLQKKEIDEFQLIEYDESLYDNLFLAIKLYIDGDKTKAAEKLLEVKEASLDRPASLELYTFIKEDTYPSLSIDFYQQGYNSYSKGKYDEALEHLNKAIEFDEANVDAIYFLGRTYHRLSDNDKAKEYYNVLVDKYPDSSRAREAKSKLKELQ